MKALLLTLGLGLVAALPAPGEKQEGSGTWYLKAIVGDKQIFRRLASVPVTPVTITILEGGNLEVNFTVPLGAQCREMSAILEKTEEPGTYTAYGGSYAVHIEESHVQDHYIVYSEGRARGHPVRMAKLLGRDPEISQDALEDFKRAAVASGFHAKNIFVPRQRESCSPGSN